VLNAARNALERHCRDYDRVLSSSPPKLERSSITPGSLMELFVPSLGDEKARAVVEDAMQRLGIDASGFGVHEAIYVLELIAKKRGTAGTVSRFLRARILLELPSQEA